jgi:hypothetical protein
VVALEAVVPVYREVLAVTMRIIAILLCLWTCPVLGAEGQSGLVRRGRAEAAG